MLITEDGRQYIENVTIDTSKMTVVHDVSGHGKIKKSHILVDFASVSTWFKDNIHLTFVVLLHLSMNAAILDLLRK